MSDDLVRLPIEQALRLADDLECRRLEHWLVEADIDDEFVTICEWSEALRDELREEQRIAVLDDQPWWDWLMFELGTLADQAADWRYFEWAADLLVMMAQLMRSAVRLGWRLELLTPADVCVVRAVES